MTPPDGILGTVGFREAVLLWPLVTLMHVAEEWPRFPAWARRFAAPGYSDREYVVTHVLTVVLAAAAAAILCVAAGPVIVFLAFALLIGAGVFWNAWFHLAGSCWSRRYCPGAVTGALLYLPFSTLLAHLALRDGLITKPRVGAALGLALVVHVAEVGHNVFKRW